MNKQDFIYFDVPGIYSCMAHNDVLKKKTNDVNSN